MTKVAERDRVSVEHVAIPTSTGWSNETILFDAQWDGDGHVERHELVARIAPQDYRVFVDQTFTRQFEVMRALAERTDVRCPGTYWFEGDTAWFGSPFWIMERVSGDIPSDAPPYAGEGWLRDARPDQQERAWWSGLDAMVRIHSLDPGSVGIPPGTFSPSEGPLEWHLDHYDRFLHWAEDGRPHLSARRALDLLRSERPPPPERGAASPGGMPD